jgi:hypothetical protein
VIRRWTIIHPPDVSYTSRAPYTHYVAVHDGRSDDARTWSVPRREYKRVALHTAVQVTIDHKGRLVEITKA